MKLLLLNIKSVKHEVDVDPENTTVLELRKIVCDKFGYGENASASLAFNGRTIDDDQLKLDQVKNLKDGSSIIVMKRNKIVVNSSTIPKMADSSMQTESKPNVSEKTESTNVVENTTNDSAILQTATESVEGNPENPQVSSQSELMDLSAQLSNVVMNDPELMPELLQELIAQNPMLVQMLSLSPDFVTNLLNMDQNITGGAGTNVAQPENAAQQNDAAAENEQNVKNILSGLSESEKQAVNRVSYFASLCSNILLLAL